MNDDIVSAAGAAGEPELQRQELADCLSILKDIDRHLTHEHVAARFNDLRGHVGWNTMPDPRDSVDRTASPRVNVARQGFGSAAKAARADSLAPTLSLAQPSGRPRRRRMGYPGPRTAFLIGAATAVMFMFAVLFVGNTRGLLQARTALCAGPSHSADLAFNPMASADVMPFPLQSFWQDALYVFNNELQEYKGINARTISCIEDH